MVTDKHDAQRRMIDAAGETLMALQADPKEVDEARIEDAIRYLQAVEKAPSSREMGNEAAEKLHQLNRLRSSGGGRSL